MMASFQLRAEIVRTERISNDIYRFTLHAPAIAEAARPGQFIMVRVQEGYDPLLRRPFSIHQATADGRIQILFKVIGRGTGIMATLDAGQRLDMIGPLGRGFTRDRDRRICLLGGGVGIAPLFYLARDLLREVHPSQIRVLLGARAKEELATLAGDFGNMGLEVQTATDDGSLGYRGMVTDLLGGLEKQVPWSVYACGPYPMMRTAAQVCKEKGWRCQVSLETFMACGLAACLGCTVPRGGDTPGYLHVCKDGPVFEADEVLWL